MKSITIRELHINTGKWVRHAAAAGAVQVTDRGRLVAVLQPMAARPQARLPYREAAPLQRDSGDFIAEDRERC
ncbi:MAG: type II toxin-antitoxin system Phd/YefM family antitoxin [Terriglobales bacterium]